MIFKGIERNDKNFRHFTFDDSDVITRNGVQYYKVNYVKSSLEGDDADEEIGYVECANVITMGGKKPKPLTQPVQPKPEPKPEPKVEPKKVGRPKKTTELKKIKVDSNIIPIAKTDSGLFEYYVDEIKSDDAEGLQEQLNERGNEGWELCGFDTNKSLFGSIHIIVIFKRKRG